MTGAVPCSLEVAKHHVRQHVRSHAPLPAPLFDCCWCVCGTTVVLVCEVCQWPVVLLYVGCEHVDTHREFLRRVMDGSWPW